MAEFEELKLTVNLVDNASTGLANIRAQLTGLTQTAGQATTALSNVAAQAQQVGNAARAATPHVSSLEKAHKEMIRSGEEAGRGMIQMALASRRGMEGFAELALGAREAFTGLRGVNIAMGELGSASRTMVVGLGSVALGVAAVGAAVAAYGISVFKFSQEMYTLSQTAKSLGMTFGAVKAITEQNERFGVSVESTISGLSRMQATMADLSVSGSQLRQQMIGMGVPPQRIDELLRETDAIKRRNMVIQDQIKIEADLSKKMGPEAAAEWTNRYGAPWGVDPGARHRPLQEPQTQEEKNRDEYIKKQSEAIALVWAGIQKKIDDIGQSFKSWGLEAVLGAVKGIQQAFEAIETVLPHLNILTQGWASYTWSAIKALALGPLLLIPGVRNFAFPNGGAEAAPPTPGGSYGLGVGPNAAGSASGFHPSSFTTGANDNNPLLHNAAYSDGFRGGGGGDSGRAQAIIKGGVYEALVEFYGFLQGGGTGGGGGGRGGVQNASLTTGNNIGDVGDSFRRGGAKVTLGPNGSVPENLPTGSATGKRAERIATGKAAMEDQLRKEGVPEANVKEAANLLAGQALAESGMNPTESHDQGTGYGIYGARLGRRDAMLNWMKANGYAPESLEGQSRYMAHEAMTGKNFGATRSALMGAEPGSRQARTNAITRNFEAPRIINPRTGHVGEAAGVAASAGGGAAGGPGYQGDLDYLTAHGGHSTINMKSVAAGTPGEYKPLDPEFVARLHAAGEAYKAETGQEPRYGELTRDAATQSVYYNRYIHGQGGIAARPGASQHQQGHAGDLPDSGFRRWLYAGNKGRFGLNFPVRGDAPHVQPDPNYHGSQFAQERPSLERAALSKPTEINSSGKLDVSVNAPPGTKVSYHGQNLLKNTSMQRQTQMMPTMGGPTVGDTADSYMRGGQ